jgi:hypothetical protein
MDTDRIVEHYFETLFPAPHLRADNLAKLGHFVETPETILIIHGMRSTGKKTLLHLLGLLEGSITRIPQPLFMGSSLFQWGLKQICLTSSLKLVRPFPNLKPIIIHCQRYLNQAFNTLPIIVHRQQITTSLQRLLTRYASLFERYDLVPEYYILPTNRWPKRLHRHLYSKIIDQMV